MNHGNALSSLHRRVNATRLATALGLIVSRAAPASAANDDVTPPVVRTHVDAIYPPASLPARKHADVILAVTVDADGHVSRVEVIQTGGTELDEAAVVAARQWTFVPAIRGGKSIASRIRIPFHFAPPEPQPEVVIPKSPAEPQPPVKQAVPAATEEVHVFGRAPPPSRGASDFRVTTETLKASPRQTAADLLASAPGVAVARPEGEAVAPRVYLRGFDAEHGQDIEFTVSGIPLNQPSHIHGQGYSDLNIIIPETVRRLRVVEGVYDPRQGDFATAGTVDFDLGVEKRGALLKGTYGSFNTRRALALWAPEDRSEDTFAAGVFRNTDGFGPGVRGAISGGVLGQYRFDLPDSTSLLVHVASHGARSALAGVVRRDDVDAGRIGFYDAYADPSARSQSVGATRTQLGLTLEHVSETAARTTASIWVAYATFRGRENFTGYLQRSHQNPQWIGRGDLIEQSNEDLGLGGKLSYLTRRHQPLSWLATQGEFGSDVRFHSIEQEQGLLKAPQNEVWDRSIDASIRNVDVGTFVDAKAAWKRYLTLRAGVRADLLVYDVDDRLANFIPVNLPQSHLIGFARTATGIAWGPRATIESDVLAWLRPSISYGEGYRSPQGRLLQEGESAPFARVKSYEAGIRLHDRERLVLTLVAYQTKLSTDLAFHPEEARLERVGPTTRKGFAAYLQVTPNDRFHLSTSATFVNATLDSPPTATPGDPVPAFVAGQSLPYVAPLVVRSDVAVHRPLFRLWNKTVEGTLGYGTTFLSTRPLPYGQTSPSYFVVDALASLKQAPFTLSLEAFNLLDARYADTEYAFVSNWQSTPVPSSLAARHITAGAPRTLLLSLAVEFSP